MTLGHTSHGASRWDVDRFDELMDRAWRSDAVATRQDRRGRGEADGVPHDGATERAVARSLRLEAAALLSKYWDVPRGQAPRADDARTRSPGFALAVVLHRG
jgi:hypothetical protein